MIQRDSTAKKIGVVLSGGGLRGTAHIGALKALVDNGIPINYISGTSAGAIVAAMYALGYSPQQMITIAQTIEIQDYLDVKVSVYDVFKHSTKWLLSGRLKFWSILPAGLLKGDKIENYLESLWPCKTMRDAKIPLAITAVDINSADTIFFTTPVPGSRFILNARYYHNAFMTDAVRASISIPGVFFPKKYRGMTLVDGAVKNNLPTDVLKYMGADIIIAIDLGYAGTPNYDIKSIGQILLSSIDIMSREVTLLKSEQYADIIIRPTATEIDLKNLKKLPLLIEHGENAVQEKIADIKKLLCF